jgi:hypothetical protein
MDSRGVYARTQKRRFVGFFPLDEAVVDIWMQQKWCRIVGYVDGSGAGPIFSSIELWALAWVEREFTSRRFVGVGDEKRPWRWRGSGAHGASTVGYAA